MLKVLPTSIRHTPVGYALASAGMTLKVRNSTTSPSTPSQSRAVGGGAVGLWWPVRMDSAKFAIRRLLSDTRAVKLRVVAHNSRFIHSNGRLCVVKAAPDPVFMAEHHPRTNTLEDPQTSVF